MAKTGAPQIPVGAVRYLAFEGGGAKGIAYVGALQAYYDVRYGGGGEPVGRFSWDLDGVAGSSVGAITALMVALDYTPAEMGNLIVRDGLFTSLFSERVRKNHFCAAASPMPGGKPAPLAGYYGAAFKPDGSDAGDRARNLKAHCCPPDAAAARAPAAAEAKAGPAEGLLGLMTGLSILDVLPKMPGRYLLILVSAFAKTTAQMARSSDEDFWDLYTEHVLRAAIAELPAAFAEAATEFDRLGLISSHLRAIGEEMAGLITEDLDAESRNLLMVGYPAVLAMMFLIVTFGPAMLPDSADPLAGGGAARRRAKPKSGRSNLLYYAQTLVMVLWAQESVERVMRDLARVTLGSRGFLTALGKGLGLDDEPPEERKKAWRSLNQYCWKLLGKHFGGFLDLLKTARDDGGLWHGDAMRDVLAFIIFNKVVVVGTPGFASPAEIRFGLREKSVIGQLADAESLSPVDLLDLVRLDAKRKRKEEAPKGDGSGVPPPPPPPPPAPVDRASRDLEAKLTALEKLLKGMALPRSLDQAVEAGDAYLLSPNEQIRAIRDWFDFAALRTLTGKDLVVTGTNISSSRPVYFRESLTPDFPVIEAVRISSSFPFLFKPTAVAYVPAGDSADAGWRRSAADRQRFYQVNYCGYFVDGGFLNNHPMDAFNGIASPAGGKESAPDSALFNTPQEMLGAPFGANVLGFHLTNSVAAPCLFDGTFKQTKATRGIGSVIEGLSGTFFASASTLRFLDPRIEQWTLPVRYGNMDLLDLKPDYFAALDVQGGNYESVYAALAGSVSEGAGAASLDEMYGLFALRGASRAAGGRGDARKNQRSWRKALKERKRLLNVPAYRGPKLRMR